MPVFHKYLIAVCLMSVLSPGLPCPVFANNPPSDECPYKKKGGGGGDEEPPETPPPDEPSKTKGQREADQKDPVNLVSGAVWRRSTDISIPCPGFDLTLTRTYSSQNSQTNSPFGLGWSHSLEPRLHIMDEGDIYLDSGDGDVTLLNGSGNGERPIVQITCSGCHGLAGGGGLVSQIPISRGPQRILDRDLRLISLGGEGWRVEAPGFVYMDFGPEGRVRRFWNAAGQSLEFARDYTNRLVSVTHSCGQSIQLEYDGDDPRIRRATVPGRQLSVEYSYYNSNFRTFAASDMVGISRVQRITLFGVMTEYYEYEVGTHNLTRCMVPSGSTFCYAYTNMAVEGSSLQGRAAAAQWVEPGRLYECKNLYGPLVLAVSASDPSDISTYSARLTWEDSVSASYRDGQQFETSFHKDPLTDQLTEIRHPCGETETYLYDSSTNLKTGEVHTALSGDYTETQYIRDASNRVTAVRTAFNAPAGQGTAWGVAYDPVSRLPAAVTDPSGRVTCTDYGADGLPATNRIQLAPGVTLAETFAYTTNGLLAEYRDPCGRATAYAYGPGGYVTNVAPAAGPSVSLEWNAARGLLTGVTRPGPDAPRVSAIVRDGFGRVNRVTLPGGLGEEAFSYDAAGRVIRHTDTAGRVTRYAWHPGGKLAEAVSDAEGLAASVSFGYSQQMDTLRITDPLGREVERYALDGLGRATNVWDVEGRSLSVRYLLGGLVSGIDRFDGTSVGFAYDAGARLARAVYPDETLAFSYLACGRPVSASNAAARVGWSYDDAGRLTNETAQAAALASRVSHSLDLSGLATNTTLSVESWALNVERSFDPAGRLSRQRMNSSTNELTHFSYSYCGWSGLLSSVSNAALTAAYASDILDRVTNITYRTAGGGLVRSFAYAYDASSLITQKVVTADGACATNAYAYDGLGRLVSESSTQSGTNAVTHFSYDLAGNRLSVSSVFSVVNNTYTHNRMDGLGYDAAGNVTGMTRGGVTLALVWNGQCQLVSVSTNGAFAESYAYDALGRRVSTTDSGGTVFHVYDGDECVADTDASGNPLRSYTWGQGIDNLLAMTVYTYPSNSPQPTASCYYAVKDHLGSVHALVDESGSVVESYSYSVWGEATILSSGLSPLTSSQFGNRYLFQGREYCFATGLYNFRARWYDPATGRWLSNDPIGISGGLNLYAFCGNNPVNYVDPDGHSGVAILVLADVALLMQAYNDWTGLGTLKQEAIYAEMQSNQETINMLEKIIRSDGEEDFPDGYGQIGQMGTDLSPQGDACPERQKVRNHFEKVSNIFGWPSGIKEVMVRLTTGVFKLQKDLPPAIREEYAKGQLERQRAYQNFLNRHAH